MIPTKLPFSKVRRAAGLVFLAGEIPLDAKGEIPDGIGPQTDLTLSRIAATLAEVGLTLDDVVAVTVHLADHADFAAFNEAYGRRFAAPPPVRTTVEARLLVPGAEVEITVVAAEPVGEPA